MMEHSSSSEVEKGEFRNISWILKRFGLSHEILTASHATSSVVEFDNPKVSLRYFLQPVEKIINCGDGERVYKYYNLCVELLEVNLNCVVNVLANINIPELQKSVLGDGRINANASKQGQYFVIIEDFLPVCIWNINRDSGVRVVKRFEDYSLWYWLWRQNDVTLKLSTQLFLLCQEGANEQPNVEVEAASNNTRPTDFQLSLLSELKTMYTAVDDNYPDLKLKTKDNMTLNAHKFIVAARSVVFRNLIDEHMKNNTYDGTIKIVDINAKSLMIILHWMYTAELHENVGKVMEEVVEASVKYQLTDLLKLLDKQLITICNSDNMFHLHQVAKKYAMPTAITETAAYIRGNI